MAKQLGEFLKEQQEPFALEAYLLERGYTNMPPCSARNSANGLGRSASCGVHKKGKFIPYCSKVVRNLLTRFHPLSLGHDHDNKIKNSASGDQDGCFRDMENKKRVVSKSCSAGDTRQASRDDGNLLLSVKEQDAADARKRNVEEGCQLSPVSVLEETELYDGSPVLKTQKQVKRIQEASSFSVCNLQKPFDSSVSREAHELSSSKAMARYTENKKAVMKTKQLLFDCVKEVVEKQSRKNTKGRHRHHHRFQKILGAEELRKLIYENIWLWSKDTIDETNIEDHLHFDQEWGNLELHKGEIAIEIGDEIFEDITNHIISDLF